jgi:hypothetical protein
MMSSTQQNGRTQASHGVARPVRLCELTRVALDGAPVLRHGFLHRSVSTNKHSATREPTGPANPGLLIAELHEPSRAHRPSSMHPTDTSFDRVVAIAARGGSGALAAACPPFLRECSPHLCIRAAPHMIHPLSGTLLSLSCRCAGRGARPARQASPDPQSSLTIRTNTTYNPRAVSGHLWERLV